MDARAQPGSLSGSPPGPTAAPPDRATPADQVAAAPADAQVHDESGTTPLGPWTRDHARARLLEILRDVPGAEARRYGATDDAGHVLHTAKILGEGPGDYLAVSHYGHADGRFHVALSTSPDLAAWHFQQDFGPGTHQPTLARAPGGGYVLAFEQDPRNHIVVQYYADREALYAGRPAREFHAPRRLSRHAEGTPNIYAVRAAPGTVPAVVDLGAHYWHRGVRDRQQRALLVDFDNWHPARQPRLDAAVARWGVDGNIGGRDALTIAGHPFTLIEGQYARGDFGTWRVYLYHPPTGSAEQVEIRTDGGSRAFANPKATVLTLPDGRAGLAVSLYVPGEGAAPGERGALIYHAALG